MKKTLIIRGLFGIPVGIAISYLITILMSLIQGEGNYFPCVPDLITQMGSEMNAVLLQTLLSAILGAVCGASSVIWEMESWSLFKQTLLHFIILSASMLPVAYVLYWMQHNLISFLIFEGIFLVIFVSIWLSQYLIYKNNIKKINSKL